MSVEDHYAELQTLTGLTPDKWRDILTLPEDAQAVVLQAYRDAEWVQSADKLEAVLKVLSVVGAGLGVVSGAAGAAGAVAALRSL